MALGGRVVSARACAGLECLLRGCRTCVSNPLGADTEAARLPRTAAFERWLALPASAPAQPLKSDSRRTDLALGRPERRVRARGVGPGRGFAQSLLKSSEFEQSY